MTEFVLQREELAAPLATPGYLLHVTSPRFYKSRALLLAVGLHVVLLVAVLLVLRWYRLPQPAPEQPTLELVMDKSAYVGSGPQALAPVPAPAPQPAAPPATKAAPVMPAAPPLPAPPPPAPPVPMAPPNPVVAAVAPAAVLPLPAPPPPAAPVLPKPAPKLEPTPLSKPVAKSAAKPAALPKPAAAPRALGDNQPVGHGEAFGRIIPARPDALVNPKPAYPLQAREHGEQGRVLLSIRIAPSGRPSEVDIVTSSGYAILDDAARSAVQHWQFTPAQAGGKPVGSVLLFPILFQLEQ